MIGCNGDCDNCTEDGAERKRQEIINKLNDKAADCLELAKSFKETTLAEQRELIFDKGKYFDVLERVLENIYWDRFIALEENKERTDTNIDLSGISEEDLKAELARRAKK